RPDVRVRVVGVGADDQRFRDLGRTAQAVAGLAADGGDEAAGVAVDAGDLRLDQRAVGLDRFGLLAGGENQAATVDAETRDVGWAEWDREGVGVLVDEVR